MMCLDFGWRRTAIALHIVSKRPSRILSGRCIGYFSYYVGLLHYFGLFCCGVMRCFRIGLEWFAEVSRLGFMRRVRGTRGVTRSQWAR